MSQDNDNEKTEEPTPQRIEKAREEGQVPRSRELTSLLMLLAGWGLLVAGGDYLITHLLQLFHEGLIFNRLFLHDPLLMMQRTGTLLTQAFLAILPFVFGLLLTAIAAPMLIGGMNLTGKAIKVNLKKLNPLSGIKRMFSAQMVSELVKAVLKVTLAALSGGTFLYFHQEEFIRLIFEPMDIALKDIGKLMSHCLLIVILSLLPMVGFDVFYQIYSNMKKLRMSRQEIKDEFKQQEGDPQIKGRIKQLQRAMSQQRMMSDVPDADVVVNNPTHYSVALKYQEGSMGAPKVVAKGSGLIALRIRELAETHRVPMLEAPPLARALYRHCDIGEAIPTDLYNAVAEVLAWVYSLRRWRKGLCQRPATPEKISVPAELDFVQESKS